MADGRETREKKNIGNQRPIAIDELTKRKAARIKRRAGVRKPASENAGVTSVRCILFVARSRTEAPVSKKYQELIRSPLCGLRDLCAMLFPFAARFSHAQNPRCPLRLPLNLADLLNGSFNLDESFSQSGT